MIDLVYIIADKESINNDLELLYSLRSVEKYVVDYNNIFITGRCPDFIDKSKVIHTPAQDIGYPMVNHWWKVRETIKKTNISNNFVLMYDDIFFVKPTKLEVYPNYAKGMLGQTLEGGWHYKVWMQNTFEWLSVRGLMACDYELHIPFTYNREKFLQMDPIFNPIAQVNMSTGQLAVRSVYGNLFLGNNPPYRKDIKLRKKEDKLDLEDADCFSIGDDVFDSYISEMLKKNFPNKSKWEV